MPTMPPVLLRATAATKTTLAIVWGAPESGTAPTTYEVRVNLDAPLDVGLTTSHIIGSLTADTAYAIGVRAISADGPSPWTTRTMETVAHLREHFYRPVRNGEGSLMVGSTVAVYQTGTTVPPSIPIYLGPTGGEERGPAWLLEEGVVDFYTDLPQIVDIVVTVPGRAEPIVFPHQWVGDILDVDLTNDTVMTAIDFDVNTQFRVQQDARHAAAYASKATQTTVETGRLTVASLNTAYATPLADHLADPTDAHDASAISVVAVGTLAATNVQAALAELDTEKATTGSVTANSTALNDHLADTVDAHDASAISVVPTGAIAATTVQAALAELDTEKATTGSVTTVSTGLSDHLADTTDAHDASAISFVAGGGLAATNVQAALAELDTEKETPAGATSKANAAAAAVATTVATAANFGSAAAAVNTSGKSAGRPGYDSTGNRPVWATGATPTSTWVYADGTTAFTPA